MSEKLTIKTPCEIELMRAAGKLTGETLKLLGGMVKAGVTTRELDEAAEAFIRKNGAKPSFLNYMGYPASICASVNEQVVHGIPGKRKLQSGDIVSVDVGVILDGWQGDAARTFPVGEIPEEVAELMRVTRESFFEGIKHAVAGNRVSDIAAAIQKHAEAHGYGVVRELTGHGIGRDMHEPPTVYNYYIPGVMGRGVRLVPGMTLAVEPMINLGRREVVTLDDGWTVRARDNKPSAHYENTIAITEGEPEILTMVEGLL